MHRKTFFIACVLTGFACISAPARADVKPHGLFTDNMVLQRGTKAAIWGTATDGEKITVEFRDKKGETTAKNGRWEVRIETGDAGGPFTLTISGNNTIEIKNVLVGEVWIASGQSNMWWPLKLTADPEKMAANSSNNQLRLFTVPMRSTVKPAGNVKGQWTECGPKTVTDFSAVAYYFGRDLQKALGVPVGMIHTSVGGTPAEAWTSKRTLEAYPELKGIAEQFTRAVEDYPKTADKYVADLEKYLETARKARSEGKPLPKAPAQPAAPSSGYGSPTVLYNGMIAPLTRYAIKGAIWYQGESNAGKAYQYQTLFPAMIKNWREDWKQEEMPFLFVQLAPFMKINPDPMESNWAELREAQRLTAVKVKNTAMAVITDVGDEKDIHPPQKEPVGARLALAARAIAYGEKIEYAGPTYESMNVEGYKATLTFKNVGRGLVAKGGPLTGFTIAGEDRKFRRAKAEIVEDRVVVSCDEVEKPVAVRFGWANYPVVNLWNKDGLPASPFRTDDFPLTTQPKTAASGTGTGGR